MTAHQRGNPLIQTSFSYRWQKCSWYPTVYPKKYAHGFCFAVLCCGYTLTDFPISIRIISLALWQSNDCPSASKATLMNMDKYFIWIYYERLHNHNKAKHNKTCAYFLGYTVGLNTSRTIHLSCEILCFYLSTISTGGNKVSGSPRCIVSTFSQ